MKTSILFGLLTMVTYSFSQTVEQKDSLINEMCKTISLKTDQPDSSRILAVYEEHLFPFLARYEEESRDEIETSIYFRFQRNCKDFRLILQRMYPQKGDWEQVTEKPTSTFSKKLSKEFRKLESLRYLEGNGNKTRVEIKNGYWIDYFEDGTFSKLKIKWISHREFDLEFVESNNVSRKNFSKSGDLYRYQILDKKAGYYTMSVEIPGKDIFMIFKLYF